MLYVMKDIWAGVLKEGERESESRERRGSGGEEVRRGGEGMEGMEGNGLDPKLN